MSDLFKAGIHYYQGAMDGYKREIEALKSFGDGRIVQWQMLIDDYKTAVKRIAEMEDELDPKKPCGHELNDSLSAGCIKCEYAVLKRRNELLEAELAECKEKLANSHRHIRNTWATLSDALGELEAEDG